VEIPKKGKEESMADEKRLKRLKKRRHLTHSEKIQS